MKSLDNIKQQSDRDSLIELVGDIFNNIQIYRSENDLKTIDNVLELCRINDLALEQALMYRAKAMNYFYRNCINEAIDCYKRGINLVQNIDKAYFVLFLIEIADLYYRENMLKQAQDIYTETEAYIETCQMPESTLFKYYYWRGIMLNNTGQQARARLFFDHALSHTTANEEKAAAMLNIALSFQKEQSYTEAIDRYNKVLEHYDADNLKGKGVVYNNIAALQIEQSNLKDALVNSTKAVALIAFVHAPNLNFVFSQTFIQIKILQGNLSVCDSFIRLLKDTAYMQVDKKYILEGIRNIVYSLKEPKELKKIAEAILEMTENIYNQDFKKELLICIDMIRERIAKISKGGYGA